MTSVRDETLYIMENDSVSIQEKRKEEELSN